MVSLWNKIDRRICHSWFLLLKASLIITHTLFPLFGPVCYFKVPVTIFLSNITDMESVFCSKGLKQAELHHIIKMTKDTHIVRNLIIVIKSCHFSIVLLHNFMVITADQVRPMERLKDFLTISISDFKRAISHQCCGQAFL